MSKSKASRSVSSSASNSLMQQFAEMVQPDAKPKAGKNNKWVMELTKEAYDSATDWANSKVLSDLFDTRLTNARAEFCEYATQVMVEKIFNNRSKPSNPLVVVQDDDKRPDHQFQFTMMDKFTFGFAEVPEGQSAREHYIQQLVDVGLHPNDAERLVDNEIDFAPIQGFRPLNELLEGRYGERREWIEADEATKNAGRKLISLVMWDGSGAAPEALTVEEKRLVTNFKTGLNVRAGFYDRVAGYCQNLDQLRAVFTLIKPIVSLAYLKWGMQDSETDKAKRMLIVAKEIIG